MCPASSSKGIFLSYRRKDVTPYARSLKVQLSERFPKARVFMDLDSIEPGLDFAEVIREAVDSCAVLVALIGSRWATLTDEEGRRRLDDPDDYVRFEVQTALERGVRVIPVLVDDARPLREQQLPSGLQKLARLQALELSNDRYEYDADRLLDVIQRVLAATAGTGTVATAPATAQAARTSQAPPTQPAGGYTASTGALPPLTPEQRAAALEKAARARKERAEVKNRLKRGATTLSAVIKEGATNDVIGNMKVSALLESLPGVGQVRAKQIMERLGLEEARRVRGLGANQRSALEQEFGADI
jgi:S13-like protein/TIR domain-containing protein